MKKLDEMREGDIPTILWKCSLGHEWNCLIPRYEADVPPCPTCDQPSQRAVTFRWGEPVRFPRDKRS